MLLRCLAVTPKYLPLECLHDTAALLLRTCIWILRMYVSGCVCVCGWIRAAVSNTNAVCYNELGHYEIFATNINQAANKQYKFCCCQIIVTPPLTTTTTTRTTLQAMCNQTQTQNFMNGQKRRRFLADGYYSLAATYDEVGQNRKIFVMFKAYLWNFLASRAARHNPPYVVNAQKHTPAATQTQWARKICMYRPNNRLTAAAVLYFASCDIPRTCNRCCNKNNNNISK